MGEDIRFEATEIDRHAQNLEGINTQVKTITSEAQQSEDPKMWGLLCAGAVGWWVALGQHSSVEYIEGLSDAVDYCATTIRSAHDVYTDTERTHEEISREIEQMIDDLDGRI